MRQFAFAVFCAGLLATQASAGILIFTDAMFGNNETPPNSSTATGQAKVTIDTIANTLRVQESWTGLIGVPTGAHIHCCALPGTAAQVALPFTSFPATTAGTYDTTFDLTLTTTYTSGFLASGGGTAAGAESLLISSMTAGLTYTNIHNGTFPGGEIRGQLAPIPEPGTMALGGAGLLGLIGVVRRRRRA